MSPSRSTAHKALCCVLEQDIVSSALIVLVQLEKRPDRVVKKVDWDVKHHNRQTKRFHFICLRAYPGSEFVVANTLAKWKKVGPKEIDFSQGFSQKVVSISCSIFNQ